MLVKRLLLLSFTDVSGGTWLHTSVTCDCYLVEKIDSLVNYLAPGCPSVDIQELHRFLESCSEDSRATSAATAAAAATA